MHRVRSAARKVAWNDKLNPFSRSRREDLTPELDLENPSRNDKNRGPAFDPAEPSYVASNDADSPATVGGTSTSFGENKKDDAYMRGARENASQPSEETAIETQSLRQPSEEEKARGRFLSLFHRKKGEEGEKSRTGTGLSKKSGRKSLKKTKFTFANQLKATLFNSWINILLIAAPVGIALANVPNIPPVAVFVVNFVAIIPLAALLSYGTEEISLRVGETLGGLLNASFGNAVELIVSIIALVKGEIVIVKTSLIGSILSNLLLVMGMCFFFGGLRRTEQFFNETVAQTAASLLALAIASVIIPTIFDSVDDTDVSRVSAISRGVSVILLAIYACYLYFQLKTHAVMYNTESQKVAMRPRKHHVPKGHSIKAMAAAGAMSAAPGRTGTVDNAGEDALMNPNAQSEEDEEGEEPQLHIWVAVLTLGASTAVVAVCAEAMVSSIDALTAEAGISKEFVGLILLPIVGNAAEHATAVTVAIKDKMDLAIGVAVGSSMQIALLVIPFSVILGWILGQPEMNLSFGRFEVVVLFVSVLLVNYLIADGKSHWLEGVLLQGLYVIIALTAWFYPNSQAAEAA